jgi:hypothetical protein
MPSQCWRMFSRSCVVVIRSMPGAPPLRCTARQAALALSRLTTASIIASCIAFCGESRKRSPLAVALPVPEAASPRAHRFCQTRVVTAVVTPRCFGRLRAGLVQVLMEFCSFVLRPFAAPGFCRASSLLWPLLTSPRLSAQGSPWVNADPVPSRCLALRAPLMSVGLRLCSPARPRSPASTPVRVPTVEGWPPALSRESLAVPTWPFGYGCRHHPVGDVAPR